MLFCPDSLTHMASKCISLISIDKFLTSEYVRVQGEILIDSVCSGLQYMSHLQEPFYV